MPFDKKYKLKYLSLFSGIGGFEVGIQNVFPHAQCVGYSEIDPNAIKVYQEHFPHHTYLGPVQKVKGNYGVDLVVGGSPCQNFSSAASFQRHRHGLDGEKSKLFYEFLRVLKENQPCYFILENVSSMPEEDKEMISKKLGVQPILINSISFSAQKRKRLYWTNIPVGRLASSLERDSLLHTEKIRDILDSKSNALEYKINTRTSQLYKSYNKNRKKYSNYIALNIVDSNDDFAPTLRTNNSLWIKDKRFTPSLIRKATPLELERLQTFPEGWTQSLPYTVAAKALGNAVTCDVISAIVFMLRNK